MTLEVHDYIYINVDFCRKVNFQCYLSKGYLRNYVVRLCRVPKRRVFLYWGLIPFFAPQNAFGAWKIRPGPDDCTGRFI